MREWEKVDMSESRVPEKAVLSFLDRLEGERCLLHGFAMLDGGKMLAEGYWEPFRVDSPHRMYSVGKSFVSLAIGLLQEEGKLALDDPICRYFPEKCPEGGPHPWLAGLTIRQMLTMTTCHSKTTYKQYGGDWVESFFRVEPSNMPGAIFSYDTSSTHVLSALVERLSGRKLIGYLREKCLDQIGVSKAAYFISDPGGVSQGGSGLTCTLRDMLAVAELVMNEGVYQGKRLLPAEYIREATACQVSTSYQSAYDEQFGYGYQIWRGRHDSFYFYGIGGQLAVCLPREQFILGTMGNTLENKNGIKDIFDAFFDIIYPWIADEGEREKCAKAQKHGGLAARLAGLSLARYPQEADCPGKEFDSADCSGKEFEAVNDQGRESETAEYQRTESGSTEWRKTEYKGAKFKLEYQDAFLLGDFPWTGRSYVFAENKMEISELCINCDDKGRKGHLRLKKGGKESELRFGLDTYVRQKFPWAEDWGQWERQYCVDVECCCQGVLEAEDLLLVRCYILGPEMANLTIVLRFQEQGITIKMQKGFDNGLKHFEGVASGVNSHDEK